jgi:hypothetical protein
MGFSIVEVDDLLSLCALNLERERDGKLLQQEQCELA